MENTIVYSWWHTYTPLGLMLSCITVVALSAGYEFLSFWQRIRDAEARQAETSYMSVTTGGTRPYQSPGKLNRTLLYGLRSLWSIKLMLIMMTFNGYLILSLVTGSILAHWILGVGGANGH